MPSDAGNIIALEVSEITHEITSHSVAHGWIVSWGSPLDQNPTAFFRALAQDNTISRKRKICARALPSSV
jgi:hypothetical protein